MKRTLLIFVATLGLGGCRASDLVVPKELDTFARQQLSYLANGDTQKAKTDLHREFFVGNIDSVLIAMREELRGAVPSNLKVIGYTSTTSDDDTRREITYEGRVGGEWELYQLVVHGDLAQPTILGMHVLRREQSLAAENDFTVRDKTLKHYLILLLAVLNAVFIFATVIVVIRTPVISRWKWIIASLVGVGTFTINWTTGESGFQPFSFLLFGAGAARNGAVGPWLLEFAFPVGAVLFWVRRHAGELNHKSEPIPVSETEGVAVEAS